uniref:Putative secreted peptide n=1 Tax=Anopheles braziliensis TaxID=58242 RepID=A0A2M3ZRW6_9DIPT
MMSSSMMPIRNRNQPMKRSSLVVVVLLQEGTTVPMPNTTMSIQSVVRSVAMVRRTLRALPPPPRLCRRSSSLRTSSTTIAMGERYHRQSIVPWCYHRWHHRK